MLSPMLILAASLPGPTGLAERTAPPSPTAARPVARAAAAAPAGAMFARVLERMTPEGRVGFKGFVEGTLLPRLREDGAAQGRYRTALQAVAAAPTLDLAAAERLISRRREAEAALATLIRSAAFAMIATLPAADRRLALTAIFADARVPQPAPPPAR